MGIEYSKQSIVLHDYFESAEGGGRLCLILAREILTDLGYGFKVQNHPYFKNSAFAGKEYDLRSYTRLPIWRQYKLARAFQRKTLFLKDYDTVIYSGFYSPLAIRNHWHGQNIYYCHTPPRFIYDQRDFYLSLIPFWQRPILLGLIRYLRPLYEDALSRMDTIITNSENVQSRIQKYLGIDSRVIYPPCETEKFNWLGQEDFYLSTARLDPLKRVDIVVKAFLDMPEKKLKVVSGGPDMPKIKKLAQGAENIQVLGWADEKMLVELVGRCVATIYIPRDEDFGMAPIESMAAGKPVIGVAEGGLLETVVDWETGILIKADPSPEDVIKAVQEMTAKRAKDMRRVCEKRALRFRTEVFAEKMNKIMVSFQFQ